MIGNFLTDEQITSDMDVVRKYCSMGHNIRKKNNLPVGLVLDEVQFNGCRSELHEDFHFLFKEFYEIIAEELNCRYVNPFFMFKEGENWEIMEDGDFMLALRVDVLPEDKNNFEKLKEYKKNMAEEKKAGTYDQFTYKKYKK